MCVCGGGSGGENREFIGQFLGVFHCSFADHKLLGGEPRGEKL